MTRVLRTRAELREALADKTDPEERDRLFEGTMVQEIMTARPQTITSDASVKDAAQRMLYLEVHRLFVEDDGKLVGVVSTTDLVRAMAGQRA